MATKDISYSQQIMQALGHAPDCSLLDRELLQHGKHLTSRIDAINDFHERCGSAWRIKGRLVRVMDHKTGLKVKATMYQLIQDR